MYSQTETDADSTLNLEELDMSDLEDMENDSDFMKEFDYSRGYFPSAIGWHTNISAFYSVGDVFDAADRISPSCFVKTAFPFSGSNPLNNDDRRISKNNEIDNYERAYPENSLSRLGLGFHLSLPLPIILDAGISVDFNDGMIFFSDKTKNYLSREGKIKQLKEAGIVYLDELFLSGNIGAKIPIYGGFFSLDDNYGSSIYYLYCGYTAGYVLRSEATQFLQIANAKSDLRYSNGKDTLRLISEERLTGLNKRREYLDIAFGWESEFNSIGLGLEARYSYPLTSAINEEKWLQHRFEIKFSIKFLGFFYL
jgi:hypothetical protein